MTGTPLDLTPFGALLQGIGSLYGLFVLALLVGVLWKVKGIVPKVLGCTVVLIVFVFPVALSVWEKTEKQNETIAKLKRATDHFEMRCKSAGEKINRTVENVEGVVWMKWRDTMANQSDQFKLDDPYGHDCGGEDCIGQLLRVSKNAELNPEGAKLHTKGYRYVDTVDPTNSQRYRYVGVMKLSPAWTAEGVAKLKKETGQDPPTYSHIFSQERQPINQFSVRYGITWDDISTREDREYWIAGGSLKVIDLQTNEVMAERVGYMMDRGLGSQAGFRSPWLFAINAACPAFRLRSDGSGSSRSYPQTETMTFVSKVLQIKGD